MFDYTYNFQLLVSQIALFIGIIFCLGIDYNVEQSSQWCRPLIQKLISVFWILYYNRPKNPAYCTIFIPGKILKLNLCLAYKALK